MLAKHRFIVLLALASLSLGAAQARAQYDNSQQSESIGGRISRFGKSIVGGNPKKQQQQQSVQRQPQARQQPMRPTNTQPVVSQNGEPDYYAAGGNAPMVQQTTVQSTAQAAAPQLNVPQAGAPSTNGMPSSMGRRPTVAQRTASRRPVTEFQNADGSPSADPMNPGTNSSSVAISDRATARAVESDAAIAATAAPRAAREPQFVAQADVAPRLTPKAESSSSSQDNLIVRRSSPSISVETIGPRKISIGKQATYKLVLKNAGDMAAADVVVSIAVPEWAEIVDAKSTTGVTEPAAAGAESQGLQWKLGTLGAAGREELSLEVVPRKSQPFELAVKWTQAPLASQTTVEVQEPKLALSLDGSKEVMFGERNTYKLTLSNPGTGDAENVAITLMPLNPADGAPASHALGVIHPGERKTIEIELVARQSGHVTIQAEATAAGDLRAALEEEVVVRRASLDVGVVGTKMQFAGSPGSYVIQIKNNGNAPARNLRVACRLPLQSEHLASSSSGAYKAESNMVQWTVDNLDPGSELKLTAKCVLRATGQNKIEVSCAADGDLQQVALASTMVQAVADLALEVTDPSGPVPVGQEMTYEVRVRNRGSKGAESVDLVAYFANGIEATSVEGGAAEIRAGMVVFRTIPVLEPGKDIVYKIKARAEIEGNLRFRTELTCQPLDTKLTQEEATLFYSDVNENAAAR